MALVFYSESDRFEPWREAFNLAQLEFIRRQIKPLRRAIEAIARRPRRVLVDEHEVVDLARAREPDDRSVVWFLSRPGEMVRVRPTVVPTGATRLHRHMEGHLPMRLQVGRSRVTYDVYENQPFLYKPCFLSCIYQPEDE